MASSISSERMLSFKPLLPSSRTNTPALPSFRTNPPSFFHSFSSDLRHLLPVSVQIPVRPLISKPLRIQAAGKNIGRLASLEAAKKMLDEIYGTEVLGYVSKVDKVVLPVDLVDHDTLTLDQIESNIVRCPDPEYAEMMIAALDTARAKGDSVGGVVTCIVRNCQLGLGLPFYNKLEAELAKAVMSLPATTGFQFGRGFAGTLTGSECNDYNLNVDKKHGKIRARTNHCGGIQGGISNGKIIDMAITFKPAFTHGTKWITVTGDKEAGPLARGVCDPCIVPRALPMVEAMVAFVLLNQLLEDVAQRTFSEIEPRQVFF